jgi:hypothetical protein
MVLLNEQSDITRSLRSDNAFLGPTVKQSRLKGPSYNRSSILLWITVGIEGGPGRSTILNDELTELSKMLHHVESCCDGLNGP